MSVRFFSMRVTSEGNNTQIVVALPWVIVVDVDAVAVSVAEIHKLAVRGKGCFCVSPSRSEAITGQTHLIGCK